LILLFSHPALAQLKKTFPLQAVTLQFAGSTGFLTAGYSRQSAAGKVDLGLLYGYTPEFAGGEDLHTANLKFIYQPFNLRIAPAFFIQPVQTGIFISQHFGKNLSFRWPEKYKKGYYWWLPSTRLHLLLGSQVSYFPENKKIKRVAFYFEANTNDLYVASYSANRNYRSIPFYDIIFFGMGTRIYF